MKKNTELKSTYDTMHETGKSAWFDDGHEERIALFAMGDPWTDKTVLEIGCGEGDLLDMVFQAGGQVVGIDYSKKAIETCRENHPHLDVYPVGIEDFHGQFDILLMQGVLEHLDKPIAELHDMIKLYEPKTVIMSMPGFLNARGVIWHTLDMLGAVMSKTDLHFIDPWQVEAFCEGNGYSVQVDSIEDSWAAGEKMVEDMMQRIPLALADGNIQFKKARLERFLKWLDHAHHRLTLGHDGGAVIIYRIDL